MMAFIRFVQYPRNVIFHFPKLENLRHTPYPLNYKAVILVYAPPPYDVLGKSGATAAMLEHGLPVIRFLMTEILRKKNCLFSTILRSGISTQRR